MPPIRDPKVLFDTVFKGMTQAPSTNPSDIVSRRRSVLDFVKGDLGRLDCVLGSSDHSHDVHLSGVRELERQLDLVSSGAAPACVAPAEPTVNGAKYSDEAELLLLDMTALALKCDLTRSRASWSPMGVRPWVRRRSSTR